MMYFEKEIWLPIVMDGEETAYVVSNLARIKRLKKGQGTNCSIIKQHQNKKTKYFYVNLRIKGKTKTCTVHRLVCAAFHGPNNTLHVAHIDGSKTNNLPENLRWSTEKENMADKYKHGTALFGEKISHSKLSSKQVCEILTLAKLGIKRSKIAKEYGIHSSYVGSLIRGEWRRHDRAMGLV
jgi:hypothetical protein